ncbi:type II secretion system protein GspM [Halanaerobium praevalens]|uniref:Pilus assembly protein PilO n=1 Tax=Halanaerobium praevalens (strain ATCC 33744 / DSM 2228 / GSL) TaxID=572479 RepID=E3DR99_HALPG|nr:type II secretion system protein GspM [Halanaerobium praevalens]ADO77005.1 hypothetical protein Hprae_0851 [Halanaerobium praevalens DSM 2228]
MSNLSKREKILLFILLITIVIVAYYYLLYQPIKSQQSNLKNQITNIQTEYSNNLAKVNKIDTLESDLAALKKKRKERLNIVIREAEEVLAAINFFANQSGIEIKSYQKNQAKNGYPFTFNLEGNYFGLLGFFKMLDNWDYRLVVENLSAESIQPGQDKINLSINLFYHQADDLKAFKESKER